MAWSLMITNGAPPAPSADATLTTMLSTADEAAGANVLLNFAYAVGGEPEDGYQALLERVAAALAEYMERVARERYIQIESATIQEEAITNVHW